MANIDSKNKSVEKIYKGFWWNPQHPETKVAGVLTYNVDKIILELIGSFSIDLEEQLCNHRLNLIHGIDSNAKEITLIDCHRTFSRNLSSEFPIDRYDCRRLIYDKHIGGLDEKRHYTAYLQFPELSYWAHPGAIIQTLSTDGKCTIGFSSKSKELLTINLNSNTRIKIEGVANFSSEEYYLTSDLSQHSRVKLEFDDEVSISEIEKYKWRLSCFLSFAFLTDVRCSRFYLHSPEEVQDFGNGQKYYFPIDVFQPEFPCSSISVKNKYIFNLSDIESNAHVILRHWMTCSDAIWPIMYHLVESLKRKPTFSSVDFLIISQAVEGFWWRFRDSAYQEQQKNKQEQQKKKNKKSKNTDLNIALYELLNEYSRISAIKLLDLDIAAAVDSRHYYSHFLPEGKKANVKEGLELYKLSMKLRKLLLCIVLTEIGFTDDQVENVCGNLMQYFE